MGGLTYWGGSVSVDDRKGTTMAASNALILARRALVVSAAALVVAVIALVAAQQGDSGSGTAESAAPEQAEADGAAALTEADGAAALTEADGVAALAEEAAASAAAAEAAYAAAQAEADRAVAPEVIAALEAQLAEARADAAAALAAVGAEQAPAGDTTPESGATVDDAPAPEPEEAPAADDDAAPDDGAEFEDAPVPEDDDTARLPGEPSDLGPSEGAVLAVVGVAHNSTLNVRDIPNGEIIARLDNLMDGARDPVLLVRAPNSDDIIARLDLERGVVATGNTRKLRTTVWHEFRFGDMTGWSSDAFLAQAGATDDATSEVVARAGELPEADTMIELGMAVARTMASEEPPSRVVVSEAPGLFEGLGQMTVDVVGVGDDSILGYRLVVFFVPAAEDWTQDDPGPFTLKSVERTVLCHSHRGVSEEGLCN